MAELETQEIPESTVSTAWLYRWMAVLTAVLILIQPILAGQFLYNGKDGWVDYHEGLANIILITAAVQTILAFMVRKTHGMGVFGLNLVLVVLIIAQIGLGYAGRNSDDVVAYHIPLGVLLFGMGCVAPLFGFFDLRAQRRIK